jgi:putative intracellular protease/amidase
MAKKIGVVIYDGFETLDVYGPLGLLVTSGTVDDQYTATLIGDLHSQANTVISSSSKLPTPVSHGLLEAKDRGYDVLLIPGGLGNRRLLPDVQYRQALLHTAKSVLDRGGIVFCVCTGSILLGATGLLNGKTATTNKRAFDLLTPHYPHVNWKREARWVVDGNIITSSGITAGMACLLE